MKTLVRSQDQSELAKRRLLSLPREPLFHATWQHAVFIHYEADPDLLQREVPFELDLFDGRAFVSLVAFTMRRMRPRFGGALSELLLQPIANHEFLNVRTYVRHQGEEGIYFMAEWLSNRISVLLGPATFGLPYRYGRISYQHDPAAGELSGRINSNYGGLEYRLSHPKTDLAICEPESAAEFLLERYTAFVKAGRRRKFFRVWHEPWLQAPVEVELTTGNLLAATGAWSSTGSLAFANYSPGVNVWMGWPYLVEK